jgi:hypothetical protein
MEFINITYLFEDKETFLPALGVRIKNFIDEDVIAYACIEVNNHTFYIRRAIQDEDFKEWTRYYFLFQNKDTNKYYKVLFFTFLDNSAQLQDELVEELEKNNLVSTNKSEASSFEQN